MAVLTYLQGEAYLPLMQQLECTLRRQARSRGSCKGGCLVPLLACVLGTAACRADGCLPGSGWGPVQAGTPSQLLQPSPTVCSLAFVPPALPPHRSNPGIELGVMLVRGERQSRTTMAWLERKGITRIQVEPLTYENRFDLRCARPGHLPQFTGC